MAAERHGKNKGERGDVKQLMNFSDHKKQGAARRDQKRSAMKQDRLPFRVGPDPQCFTQQCLAAAAVESAKRK